MTRLVLPLVKVVEVSTRTRERIIIGDVSIGNKYKTHTETEITMNRIDVVVVRRITDAPFGPDPS